MEGYEGALVEEKYLPLKERRFTKKQESLVAITAFKPGRQHKKTYGEEIIFRLDGYGANDKAEAFKVKFLSTPENIKVTDNEACIVLSYKEKMEDYLTIKKFNPVEEEFLYAGPFGYFAIN